jgi:carbonic anhydrase
MSATDGLLANNQRYAEAFPGPVPGLPSLGVAVVACMDARMDVYALLGLTPGQAHVMRNARRRGDRRHAPVADHQPA